MNSETADRAWFIVREPRCVPEVKGPCRRREVKAFLIELMTCRPAAFITVLTFGMTGPMVQDGPECLEMIDDRHRFRAQRHRNRTVRAAA